MKKAAWIVAIASLAVALAGGGYWMGARKVAGEHAASTGSNAGAIGKKNERKVKFYRNPMGLPDTSPTPKKDPMGMDYVPVYEGESESIPASDVPGQVNISTDKVQKLGVRTESASLKTLDRIVRAAGRIEPDERRTFAISPKFEGYVERLYVNATGQPVGRGQPLFEVYSPELVSAQREYAIAAQGVQSLKESGDESQTSMKRLAEASLTRLKNWDISEDQIKSLAASGETRRTMTFRSPASGIVTEKKALQGMRFMPGEELYQVTDLSSIWIIADVFEQEIGLVKPGSKASIKINAYQDKVFSGAVTYVYPTLKTETRTIPVRIELANPGNLLKPGMYAQVEIPVLAKSAVVTVPNSAVIDSGTRRIVLVQINEGRFEPRPVRLGSRSENYTEIIEGIKAGEQVVIAANFLIDAESNLKAALNGLGQTTKVTAPEANKTVHQAEGVIEGLDAKAGLIKISHGPVESLKWPAMTMEFKVANSGLLKGLTPNSHVVVDLVERQPGDFVITGIKLKAADSSRGVPASSTNPHAGH